MHWKKGLLYFALFAAFLCGCGGKKKYDGYLVGVDPTWYPLELAGREKNILAFSIELLQEIAKKENLQLAITSMNWDNLLWGLHKKKYDAILSSIEPYVFYEKKFSFSYAYLMTGPTLIVPTTSEIDSIEELKGKEIGVIRGSSAVLMLQKYKGIILHKYDSAAEILNALEDQQIEGAVIDILIAQNYIQGLYQNKLKIATNPLSDQGLRLITIYNKAPELIVKFDMGLKAIKKSGQYEKLLKKWGLSPDEKPTSDLDKQIESYLQKMLF